MSLECDSLCKLRRLGKFFFSVSYTFSLLFVEVFSAYLDGLLSPSPSTLALLRTSTLSQTMEHKLWRHLIQAPPQVLGHISL